MHDPALPNPSNWLAATFPLLAAGALAVLAAVVAAPAAPAQSADAPPPPKFIGTKRCKMCHSAAHTGNAFGKWESSAHAGAWKVLASDAAKKLAAERGVAGDPQQAKECLRCHVTAYGEKPERLDKTFEPKDGVSCESCHGPGEAHAKARLKGAIAAKGRDPKERMEVPAGEIVTRPEPKTCLTCHNDQSPSFKPFCFRERLAQIRHPDPRKTRDPAVEEALKCACEKPCACTQAQCGGWPTEKELAAARERLAAKGTEGGQ